MPKPPHKPSMHVPPEGLDRVVTEALEHYRDEPGNLLPILHAIQDALGHIPAQCVPDLARALNRSRAEIHGVISFYADFRQAAPAPVQLRICRAEACQAMGTTALIAHAQAMLGCDFNETSRDGLVDLSPVYCLGLCAQAPAITLNGQPHARVSPASMDDLLTAARRQHETTHKGSQS